MNLYRFCIRPLLFRLDAERAHEATACMCGALGRWRWICASLVEILTGLVYRGLGPVTEINRGLVWLLARDDIAALADAVGIDNRPHAPV